MFKNLLQVVAHAVKGQPDTGNPPRQGPLSYRCRFHVQDSRGVGVLPQSLRCAVFYHKSPPGFSTTQDITTPLLFEGLIQKLDCKSYFALFIK